MNTKKWITGAAVVAVSASLAMALPQEGKGWGGHKGQGAFGEKFAKKLNLTDAQKQQLSDLKAKFRSDNAAFLQSFRQTMTDFHAAKKANDTAKLAALKPTVESQKAQMKQLRQAQEPKILSILTPDQQAQYKALKAEHEAREQKRGQQ
jgi:Spy/CpxP family protein refolding chaperone